jgi:hypothetical protein
MFFHCRVLNLAWFVFDIINLLTVRALFGLQALMPFFGVV